MRHQLEADEPLKKRLWQSLVRAKIRQQGAVLERAGQAAWRFRSAGAPGALRRSRECRGTSGTPLLAVADGRGVPARPPSRGANAMLNYGYTVLRSGVARAVVYDRVAPFTRPAPFQSWQRHVLGGRSDGAVPAVGRFLGGTPFVASGETSVTAPVKASLATMLGLDVTTARGTTPVSTCLERLALSLAGVFEAGKGELELPTPLPPVEFPDERRETAP